MYKLLLWLLGACDHEWEVVNEIDMKVQKSYGSGLLANIDEKHYHLRCKKCGEMTKRVL